MSDQTVLVRLHRGHQPRVYHRIDEDGRPVCRHEGRYREMSLDYAQHTTRESRCCRRCDGHSDGGDTTAETECPACGEPLTNTRLPYHIQTECDGVDREVHV